MKLTNNRAWNIDDNCFFISFHVFYILPSNTILAISINTGCQMGARNSAPPLRVAKCQFFYTEQNRQTKFYPNKNVWIATVLAQNWTKLTQRILWWTTVHLPSKLGLKFYISMLNKSSQERLDFVKFACYPKSLPQPSNIFTRILGCPKNTPFLNFASSVESLVQKFQRYRPINNT